MNTSNDMKTVGSRTQKRGDLESADGFLKLVIALRGDKPFFPRGIHRFESFEKAQAWSLQMMAGKKADDGKL